MLNDFTVKANLIGLGRGFLFSANCPAVDFVVEAYSRNPPGNQDPFFPLSRHIDKKTYTSPAINPYYAQLSPGDRAAFGWRVFYFLDTTEIVFRNFEKSDRQLFEKLKLLLAAVAAQMTLYLPEDCFKIIHTIIVYPEPFVSHTVHRVHKGETNPGAGVIVLSLTGIQEGIREPYDGINLIIHEYAHALWLEHKLTSYEIFTNEAADRFEAVAMREFRKEQQVEKSFFRKYGRENIVEFIAVAMENFFERPWEFAVLHAELYHSMTAMFKQDPATLLPQREM